MSGENTPTPTPSWFASEFRKVILPIGFAILSSFIVSWVNTQMSLNDIRNKVERVEEKQLQQAAQIADNAKVNQQNALTLLGISKDQERLAGELKDLKDDYLRRR